MGLNQYLKRKNVLMFSIILLGVVVLILSNKKYQLDVPKTSNLEGEIQTKWKQIGSNQIMPNQANSNQFEAKGQVALLSASRNPRGTDKSIEDVDTNHSGSILGEDVLAIAERAIAESNQRSFDQDLKNVRDWIGANEEFARRYLRENFGGIFSKDPQIGLFLFEAWLQASKVPEHLVVDLLAYRLEHSREIIPKKGSQKDFHQTELSPEHIVASFALRKLKHLYVLNPHLLKNSSRNSAIAESFVKAIRTEKSTDILAEVLTNVLYLGRQDLFEKALEDRNPKQVELVKLISSFRPGPN